LLKDKIENLRRSLAYTEDVLSHQAEDVKRQLIEARGRISELENVKKSLESENKVLTRQSEKALKSIKDSIPMKEHEETVTHYRFDLINHKIAKSKYIIDFSPRFRADFRVVIFR
jgi:hypothetical protein